jgi:hypothetical protein
LSDLIIQFSKERNLMHVVLRKKSQTSGNETPRQKSVLVARALNLVKVDRAQDIRPTIELKVINAHSRALQQKQPHVASNGGNATTVGKADAMKPLLKAATQKNDQRAEKAFAVELARVAAFVANGLDPGVSIPFAGWYADRSRATLYRAFGTSLPKPTKIGKSSKLPFSAVHAYAKGAPMPVTNDQTTRSNSTTPRNGATNV